MFKIKNNLTKLLLTIFILISFVVTGSVLTQFWGNSTVVARDNVYPDNRSSNLFNHTPTSPQLVDRNELEEQAGFTILEPTYLPKNCKLSERYYTSFSQEVDFIYRCDRSTAFDLVQKKGKWTKLPHIDEKSSETVEINGQQAIYVDGGWLVKPNSEDIKWVSGLNQQVFMEIGTLRIHLLASNLNKDELLRIIGSLE